MSKTLWLILACLGLFAGMAHASEAGAQAEQPDDDQIVRFDGRGIPTKVIEDDYVWVKGKKGFEIKQKAYEVKDVIRGNADQNYGLAREMMEKGKYRVACLCYERALKAMAGQKWAEEYCNFGIAQALYANNEFKGFTGKSGTVYSPAAVYYKKALEANPKSRFLPVILTRMALSLMEEGKFSEAEAALQDAQKRIKAYGDEIFAAHNVREPGNRARAMLAVADAAVAERRASQDKSPDWNAVKDKWLTARARAMEFPEINGEAVDGMFRTLLAMKDYTSALSEADNIIGKYKKDGDVKLMPLLPGAYFARGSAYLQQAIDYDGKGQKTQANDCYANARWAFINVMAQFFDNDEYVVKSHFFAGECYDKLRDLEPDAADKAVREWRLIVTDYPYSGLKDQALAELKRVGASVEPVTDAAKPEPNAEPKAEPPAAPAKAPAKGPAKK